jgi:hypothetical protein
MRGKRYPEEFKTQAVKQVVAKGFTMTDIAKNCIRQGKIGHFASVSVANSEDAFDPDGNIPALPLWRGHGLFPRFEGLLPAILQ